MSRSNKFHDKLIIVCAAKREKKKQPQRKLLFADERRMKYILKWRNKMDKKQHEEVFIFIMGIAYFSSSEEQNSWFCFNSASLPTTFYSLSYRARCISLNPFIIYNFIKSAEIDSSFFCSGALLFKTFFFCPAMRYHIQIVGLFAILLPFCSSSLLWLKQDILIALAYVNTLFPCFWDIRIIKWTLSLINLTNGIYIIYIGHYWFRNWTRTQTNKAKWSTRNGTHKQWLRFYIFSHLIHTQTYNVNIHGWHFVRASIVFFHFACSLVFSLVRYPCISLSNEHSSSWT